MDREGSIELLRGGPSGVKRWNRHRESGARLPDLSDANLSRCCLLEVNLRGVRLCGAFFGGSHLDRADLRNADLRGAEFRAARLYQANFQHADLRGANLCHANLHGGDFSNTDLREATLLSIDLSRTVLRVADPLDVEASLGRIDRLQLPEESKGLLKKILQELEFDDDLSISAKTELTSHVDELAKALLTSPVDFNRVTQLLELMSKIAPHATADASHLL